MLEKLQLEMAARKVHATMLEKLHLEMDARQAHDAVLQMEQVTKNIDHMLLATGEEVAQLEAQVAAGGLNHRGQAGLIRLAPQSELQGWLVNSHLCLAPKVYFSVA